jgi:hypothetical protein
MSGTPPSTPRTPRTPSTPRTPCKSPRTHVTSSAPTKKCYLTPPCAYLKLKFKQNPESCTVIKTLFPKQRIRFDKYEHVQRIEHRRYSDNGLVPFNYDEEWEADEYAKQLKTTADKAHGSTNKNVMLFCEIRALGRLLRNFSCNKEEIFEKMRELFRKVNFSKTGSELEKMRAQYFFEVLHSKTSSELTEALAQYFCEVVISCAKAEFKKEWLASCGTQIPYGKHKINQS